MELPDADGFLPILDVKLKIRDDGTIEYKLYRKPASKGLTLHFRSHHPSSTKRAVVQNELRTERRCTPQHREQALSDTTVRLRQNGYPIE